MVMGDSAGELRGWEELIPDALGLIFRNLSLEDVRPYIWQNIDLEEWSERVKPDQLERLLRMLLARNCGSVQRIAVSALPTDALFSLIADNAANLQTLVLPRSEISDTIILQASDRLSNLTFLDVDVSYCKKIGARSLEAIGKHCKSLQGLRRTMHPLEVADKVSQDDEALAIATTMPKLLHLEVAYLLLTTHAVLEILARCKELGFLYLRGCWEVQLDDKLLKERHPELKVLGPEVEDSHERSFWDECSEDYSDSSDYSWEFMGNGMGVYDGDTDNEDGVWDDDQGLEGLEVRFYGGGFNQAYAGFHWPPSP